MKILVNATQGETRVAILENNSLQEIHIERTSHLSVIANIYKGKVLRVLPGLQAAFVDIGLERTAFLRETEMLNGPVLEGQEILVQVLKNPIGTKGASLTMQLSISARELVLTPYMPKINVSLKITDPLERERLVKLLDHGAESAYGYIIRTSAEGKKSLTRAKIYLEKQWANILQNYSRATSGQLVYQDLPVVLRIFRDLVNNDSELVLFDSKQQLQQAQDFVRDFVPEFSGKIAHHSGDLPIFELDGVELELSKALLRKVPLKSGGHLIIDQSEAMTTIDINTGAFVGGSNLENTAYKTNLEAASTIARQLRLRNLGGIIIIDFIDMLEAEHQQKVLAMLAAEVAGDYIKTNISSISDLGLVQITRKRTRESLKQLLCEPCSTCNGKGYVSSVETLCFDIIREATKLIQSLVKSSRDILIIAAPAVAAKLSEGEHSIVSELERTINRAIKLQVEPLYPQEQYDMVLL